MGFSWAFAVSFREGTIFTSEGCAFCPSADLHFQPGKAVPRIHDRCLGPSSLRGRLRGEGGNFSYHRENAGGFLGWYPSRLGSQKSPLKGDMGPNKYPRDIKVYMGLIIKGTIPRVPAFSL